MRYIKKFESFTKAIKEGTEVRPDIDTPTKPSRPAKPGKPIVRPSVDPAPKARKKKTTELDVAKRFIDEVNKKGESIEKYIKK